MRSQGCRDVGGSPHWRPVRAKSKVDTEDDNKRIYSVIIKRYKIIQ